MLCVGVHERVPVCVKQLMHQQRGTDSSKDGGLGCGMKIKYVSEYVIK